MGGRGAAGAGARRNTARAAVAPSDAKSSVRRTGRFTASTLWLCACGPAVPADTSAGSDQVELDSDGQLPPLTSGTTAPGSTSGVLDTGEPGERLDLPGTAGIPPEDPCAAEYPVEPLTPWVMFVVDLSSSMVTQTIDQDADEATPEITRWSALHQALADELPSWDRDVHLGLRTFPSPDAAPYPDALACAPDGIVVNPSSGGAGSILDALPPADDRSLTGAAPLRAAVHEARAVLSLAEDEPDVFTVIITDGAPNCAPGSAPPDAFELVDTEVTDVLFDPLPGSISTTIIAFDVPDAELPGGDGEPMANPRQVLDSMAFASTADPGARHAADTPSLKAQLAQLHTEFAGRRVPVPDPIGGFVRFDVEIDGAIYFQVNSCGQDGYLRIYGETHDSLLMCGAARTALQRTGMATLRPYCGGPPPPD